MTVKDQLGDDPTQGAASHTTTTSFAVEMDRDPPTVAVNHEGLEPWLGDDREIRTTVTGTDSGAGVKSFTLDFPTGADETRTRTCSGTSTNRCPTQGSEVFTYRTNTGRFPNEGRHQLRATVGDARGSTATSQPWQVGIDRTAPALALSGALYDRRGQELPEGSYQLDIRASDGDAGSDASARSGVRSLDILLNGESVDFAQQDCPTGSCALERSWTFDTAEHPGGEHVVEVVSEDQLGQQRKESFKFDGGPCCIGSSSLWGNALGKGPVLFGDVNGDARTDALGRNALTRHGEVALSTGSSFAPFEDWGALAEFRTLTDLGLGDVNYDGLDDLVGRNTTTGQVWAAASNGTAFETPTVWGSWPSTRTLEVVDVDGDGSVDLSGRDENDGRIYVGYSDDTAFEEPLAFTDYAVPAGDEWELADVDSDFSADLIVRSGDAVSVGRYQDSTFEPLSPWGSLPAGRTALFGDVNGDGAADMLGYDTTSGAVTLSRSTRAAFEEPRSFGEFPLGHRLTLVDGDANGQADIAGEQALLGDLRVALTDMVMATGPPAEDWEPSPGTVYDDEDETLPVTDPEEFLEDPPIEPLAAASARKQTPLRLAFQDERRLTARFGITGEDGTRIEPDDAYGSRADEAERVLDRTVYRRLSEAGGNRENLRPEVKPVMRFIVLWGLLENAPGSVIVNGVEQKYSFANLDRAVNQARRNGFHVHLTLSGAARVEDEGTDPLECRRDYNEHARACVSGPTGRNVSAQDIEEFGAFAAATARHFEGRVSTFGIWNEPNNAVFLRAGNNRFDSTHVLYRRLYQSAYSKIKALNKGARIFIGELSHLTRSLRVAGRGRGHFSATTFLRLVVKPYPESSGLVRTHGVAWHPYQHADPPNRAGRASVVGIGKANKIQDLLEELHKREGGGPRLLATPEAKRPSLFFTEFGYFNGPYPEGERNPDCPKKCGTSYYKTEADRADLLRQALTRAQRVGAKWMLIYQATEISPTEYGGPERYQPEYGLFDRNGDVTGQRSYGKGPNPKFALNTPERRAYCAIYSWARFREYRVSPESPCPR